MLKGMGWTLGARYYYGFLEAYKDKSGTNVNSLFLKVNFPIGLSFEKKEQIRELKAEKKEKKAEKKKQRKEAKNKAKEERKKESIEI
jgi:outer membrane protein TolC